MTFHLRRFALLALTVLGLILNVSAADSYLVKCRWYYQDAAINQNDSVSFVTPIGLYGGYVPGTSVTFTCNPTAISTLQHAQGYYVTGWDLDSDWGDKYPGTFTPTHLKQYGALNPLTITFSNASLGFGPRTCELIPHISMMHYTLAYDKNASTATGTAPATADHYWSESVTAAASVFTRTGYTPTGWNTKSDGSGVVVAWSQAINGATFPITAHQQAVTLYAQWKVNQYPLRLVVGTGIEKIYYKVNGATSWSSVSATTDIPTNYGTEWFAYAEAKQGYSGSGRGWSEYNTESGTMGVSGASFAPVATAGSIPVAFFGNGATSGTMDKQYLTVDKTESLRANAFVRGYTVSFDTKGGDSVANKSSNFSFNHWNDKADGSGSYDYLNQADVKNPCGSTGDEVKLYAQWSSASAAITLPTPSYAGHTFAGWYADSALSEFVGNAGASYTPTNNTTLYAKWTTEAYTVKFFDDDPVNGGQVISEQNVAYGGSAVEPDHPTKKHYKFSSWNRNDWNAVKSSMNVWPLWVVKNYRIKYWSNYCNGQEEESNEDGGCNINTPQSVLKRSVDFWMYEKTGYYFRGWHTDPTATEPKYQPSTSEADSLSYVALEKIGGGNEVIDFYAIWSPNPYSVRFDGNGETGGLMSDQAFRYDQAQALTANGFTCEGQELLCWHDAKNNADYIDGQVVSNLTTLADDVVILKAVWSNYHYVRFDRNGATNETEMALQKFSGAETNALSANAYGKVGYTFAGWATNVVDATNLVVTYTNSQAVSFPLAQPNDTNTLYAVWSTNHYTIVFDPGTNGVLGTMADLSNCVYDTAIPVPCAYTNYLSYGFLGWARSLGGEVEVPARKLVASNLTAEAEGTVTLFAVWDGLGELSEAVGLTNAVLRSTLETVNFCWRRAAGPSGEVGDTGHDDRVACTREATSSKSAEGPANWVMSAWVKDSGTLRFKWYYRRKQSELEYTIYNGSNVLTNLPSVAAHWDWEEVVELQAPGDGWHEIKWSLNGTITAAAVIAVDDVTWTPGVVVKPGEEMPTYETKEAAESAAKMTTVVRPNDEVAAVVSAEDYNAMFDVLAVPKTPSVEAMLKFLAAAPDAGEWTLAIQLKPSVSNEVQSALNEAETNLCSVITNNPISVSVAMKAGLYYGLAATNEVEWLDKAVPGSWVLGNGQGGQSVSADRPSDAAAFYELRMAVNPEK